MARRRCALGALRSGGRRSGALRVLVRAVAPHRRRLPLSIAFPTAIGLSMVAIAVGSALVLGESVGATHVFGMALILAGIALVVRAGT